MFKDEVVIMIKRVVYRDSVIINSKGIVESWFFFK